MHQLAQRSYDVAPSSVQALALNVYGLRTRRRQASSNRLAISLAASEHWSVDEQRAYVDSQLRVILLHAVEHVPRYCCLRHLAVDLVDPRSDAFEILREFPIVSREEIIAQPNAFLSDAFRKRSLASTRTSGTTGTPFRTWVEPFVERVNDAVIHRRNLWAGYQAGDWMARLVGDPVIPRHSRGTGLPFRVSHTDRRLYLSTYHLSRGTARVFADALEEWRPQFLMGYPSALEAMAIWANGRAAAWRPKAVLFSSEPLYAHQKSMIEAFVSAPLRGFYGCAERVLSAAQCEHGTYHLSLVDGYAEGQFHDGTAAEEGGQVATPMTTLLNRAMPLIRYRLGDKVEFPDVGACACGRTLPVASPVITKLEDAVVTPSGRIVSPSILTWAFKDVAGLQRSQVVQVSATELDVRVVVDEGHLKNVRQTLAKRLGSLVFEEMKVSVRSVPTLELTRAGKTRFVVNECPRCNGIAASCNGAAG